MKNVSGFDVCRLLVGSRGTLGFLGEVILRTRPIAPHSQWFTRPCADPWAMFAALYRPVSVLWDGSTTWVLLEGHALDVAEQAAAASLDGGRRPPAAPDGSRGRSPRRRRRTGRPPDASSPRSASASSTTHAGAGRPPAIRPRSPAG